MSVLKHPRGPAGGTLADEALRALVGQVSPEYDADEFDLGIVVNQSLKDRGGSTLFVNVPVAHRLAIQVDKTGVTLRFSSAAKPPVKLDPYQWFQPAGLQFTDLFVSTTEATTHFRVMTW